MGGKNDGSNSNRKRGRKSALFTDKYIKSLKPESKMYQVREGRGFAIRVLSTGTKTWYYVYSMNGIRRQMNLGQYPGVSLEAAHREYRKVFDLVAEGIDPQALPERSILDFPQVESLTVAELVDLYVAHIKGHLVPLSVVQQQRTLNRDVVPIFGHLAVASVRRRDAIALIEKVAYRARGQARNVMKTARTMYSYALEREYVEMNPFAGIGRAVPVVAPKARSRVLTDEEIRHIWFSVQDDEIGRALRLILTTGQRPGEVAGLVWSEIVGDWWTIPVERSKNSIASRAYLADLSKFLLSDNSEHQVFPVNGRGRGLNAKGSMRTGTISHFLTDNNYFDLPRWTPHDLRRTMATGLAALGCSNEVINAVLNHKKKGIIGVYNLHEYDKEKKSWLERWDLHLKNILKK